MSTHSQNRPALEIQDAVKKFGRSTALGGVSLSVMPGELRGVIGRNGAGKSTLMGIASGFLTPDSGRVLVKGEDVAGLSRQAYRNLVGMVHQHSTLVRTLSIAENFTLGTRPPQRAGLIDWRELNAQAQALLDEWDSGLSATQLVAELTLAQRQLVEIIRELARGVDVVILDEPTSRLEKSDIAALFSNVRRLSERGTAVIYISHHLAEIHELCESVTILRDGQLVETRRVAETSEEQLVLDMIGNTGGSQADQLRPLEFDAMAEPAIVMAGVTGERLNPFDLKVRPGECVGIAGLIGSGKEDLGLILGGLMAPTSGEVRVSGRPMALGSVRGALGAGIGFLPPDRHETGLVLAMSIRENITMTIWDRLQNSWGLLRDRVLTPRAQELAADTGVTTIGDHNLAVGTLSGGNQQKVAIGRAIANEPQVLVLMNPTTGVDIASKRTIYELIQKELGNGKAVILISDEPDEFSFCNRIVALFRGHIAQEISDPTDEAALVAAIEGVGAEHAIH